MGQNIIVEALYLTFHLPSVPPGVVYQLSAISTIVYNADDPNNPQTSLTFRKVTLYDGIPLSDEPLIFKPVHVHEAMRLRVGTLWTAEGAPLGSSPLLQSCRIALGPAPIKPQRLIDILPAIDEPTKLAELRHFLSSRLLHKLSHTPFVQILYQKTIFLVPCSELARAFYFWTGPKMVDFFFSSVQAKQLCQAQRAPNVDNRQRAKIMLVVPAFLQDVSNLPKAYTPIQIAQLAHLFYSPPFTRSFNLLHSSMKKQWEQGRPAHVWLTLELGKRISADAEGFAFTHEGTSYFWTCSLPKRSSYFCFAHLDYVALYDTRKASTNTTDPITSPPTPTSHHGGTRARLQIGPAISHDSNQAGSSQYAGAQIHIPNDEIVRPPSIKRNSKKLIKEHIQKYLMWWVKGRPTVLSERAGGCDLTVAMVDLHLDVHRLSYVAYFEAIVSVLSKRYTVNCLTQNRETGLISNPYCLLPAASRPNSRRPYRVAVAETVTGSDHRKGYFYFFQVLDTLKLRSGFVYKSDQKQLTSDQLDDLLKAIHEKKDNWAEVKKDLREGLSRKFGVELVVLARNHKTIKKDAERCMKEMRLLAGLKEIKSS